MTTSDDALAPLLLPEQRFVEANGCFDWVIAAAANPGLDGGVGMMDS